jgi:hypothetical protein
MAGVMSTSPLKIVRLDNRHFSEDKDLKCQCPAKNAKIKKLLVIHPTSLRQRGHEKDMGKD